MMWFMNYPDIHAPVIVRTIHNLVTAKIFSSLLDFEETLGQIFSRFWLRTTRYVRRTIVHVVGRDQPIDWDTAGRVIGVHLDVKVP